MALIFLRCDRGIAVVPMLEEMLERNCDSFLNASPELLKGLWYNKGAKIHIK